MVRSDGSSRKLQFIGLIIPIIAVLLAFTVGALLIVISEGPPLRAYLALFKGALGSSNSIAETLVKTTPLLLAGLGIAIAFRTRVYNIGAEGQIVMGTLGAGYIGLFLGENIPSVIGIPLALFSGFLLGAIWGGIAGLLKLKLQANEIIVTLMMNYIAIEFSNYLIIGPWRDPNATEAFTEVFAPSTILPILLSKTRLHGGIIVAILATLILWWMINHTVLGFQLKVMGANEEAAQYSGIHTGRMILVSMLVSGGLAGLAGAVEVQGLHHRIMEGISSGYGYTAIAIAILGRGRPIGVLFSSFLFAALVVGADGMQRSTGVPVSIIIIIEGLVLLFILGSELLRQRFTSPD